MKTFYIPNMSSSDVAELPCQPWETQHGGYPVQTKDEYDKWVGRKTTDHCFFTPFEGVNPHRRITVENPPMWMHGWVVDYDSPLPDNFDLDEMLKRGAKDALPAAVSKTFSGNARVVWEFEKPILVDNPQATKALLKDMAKRFKAAALLPGMDDCSFRPAQFYEIGHSWTRVPGDPVVSEHILHDLAVSALSKVDWNKVHDSDLEIPMDRIAAEVEARWPGRWPGEFKLGARGPTFWIEDGVDRVGCQVAERGVVCYTDRAGKSFIPWDELLGKKFTDSFREEVIGRAVGEYYYDGKSYWFKNGQDRWYDAKVENVARSLRVHGIKTESKKGASQMDRVLHTIETQRRVDAALPVLFTDEEIVEIGNDRVLNVNYRRPLPPADDPDEAKWAFIRDWIWNCFGEEQLPYFLAWFKRFYEGALNNEPTQGQLVVIAGSAGQGKTLLSWRVIGAAVGGFADAVPYLQGKTSFNKAAAENPVWSLDDPQGSVDPDKHRAFGEALKAMVANPIVNYHPKFKDSVDVPWLGRIVMTCNTDPKSLSVLPPLEGHVTDKIMMFKFTDHQPVFGTNQETEARIEAELPHFLAWLTRWTPDPLVLWPENPRFGVQPYKHPELVHTATEDSPVEKLEELLDMWAEAMRRGDKSLKEWHGTATELFSSLLGLEEGRLKPMLNRYNPTRLGRELRTLHQLGKSRVVRSTHVRGRVRYYINVTQKAEE